MSEQDPSDVSKVLRMVYADAAIHEDPMAEEFTDRTMAALEERAEEDRLVAAASLKDWPRFGPKLSHMSLSPLRTKLFAVWHMMHEGLLSDESAVAALNAIVEESLPHVEQALHCRLCQRDYGVVRMRQGAAIEVECEGCLREGRR